MPAWRHLNNFDWILFLTILAACSVGLAVIYSATTGTPSSGAFHRQMIWLGLGLVLMFVALLIDYHALADFSYVFYGLGLVLLVLTLLFGRVVNASKSWLGVGGLQFQPSELVKVATILMIAAYMGREQVRGVGVVHFTAICAFTGLPVLLIM
ncbi:MAG: FtsW/RodA/SpoVE family cell cycle protein, partial [Acidobacteria bacterium]|nr:FtsW/RodA/SpoVE family cell cycle protein [Acidobacteriota bacterium]